MSMEASKEPIWGHGDQGEEVEWTDFGSNALFAVKSEEASVQDHEKRGRRQARPEIRLAKSSEQLRRKSRESQLRQKSMERRKRVVDTKMPIASIRPKKSKEDFLTVDDTADPKEVPTMSGISVEVDEDEEQGGEEPNVSGVVASPVPVEEDVVDYEMGEILAILPILSQELVTDSGTPVVPVPEMAPTRSEDMSVYSKTTQSDIPSELVEHMDSLEDVGNRNLSTSHFDKQSKRDGRCRQRCWISGVCTLLVLVIVATVLGAVLGGRKSTPTATSESTPTATPTTEIREVTLENLITAASLDGGAALSNPFSPQSKALMWLRGNMNLETYPDWRKIQRHTLAAFYYGTNGDGWIRRDGWLTDEHECDWFTSDEDAICDENGTYVQLALSNNNVTGPLPSDLAILSDSMRSIAFQNSSLSGSIPTEIALLTNLDTLHLVQTGLSGPLPSELGQLTELSHLSLQGNSLSGTIPSELGNLESADRLWFQGNSLNGTLPVELTKISKLAGLFLSRNNISGTLPSEIGLLTNLKHLQLDQCKLTGTIPSEIGLTKLVEAVLSENDFIGSIPSEIGMLEAMRIFSLSSNSSRLNGTLPSEIGQLSSLRLLTIYSAAIDGTIPTEIGLLSSLGVLILGRTELSGPIPSEIENLKRLARLVLSQNKLSGTIPTEIGAMTNLVQLHLEQQELFGTIPTELSQLSSLDSFVAFSNELTGEYTCPEFIETCAISCNNGDKDCRSLR